MTAREELAALLLHERVRAVMRRGGVTQEEFAAKMGVGRSRANAWARGRSGIGETFAARIAAYASEVYDEPLPTELFMSARQSPLEEAAAQLIQTGESLERAMEVLIASADRLVPLLERQEAVVGEMQTVLIELRQLRAASERA